MEKLNLLSKEKKTKHKKEQTKLKEDGRMDGKEWGRLIKESLSSFFFFLFFFVDCFFCFCFCFRFFVENKKGSFHYVDPTK